jgi:hypothetical protein
METEGRYLVLSHERGEATLLGRTDAWEDLVREHAGRDLYVYDSVTKKWLALKTN